MDVATLIPIETNRNIPELAPGDTVRVSVKVVEGTRERIQVFEGVVIRVRKGTVNANFTVRRIASHSVGVERTFFLHSPRVDKVEVVRHGVVRRAKLYYLRGRTGRAARLRERRVAPGKRAAQVAAAAAAAEAAAAEAAAAELLRSCGCGGRGCRGRCCGGRGCGGRGGGGRGGGRSGSGRSAD